MREIKFRGLYQGDLDTPRMMVSGSLLYFSDTDCSIVNTEGKEYWAVDPETVGQFTGLYDAAGKEIYEGDIIKGTEYPFEDEGNKNYVGVIVFDVGDCGWFYDLKRVSTRVRGSACGGSLARLDPDQIEVIGNIHEDPNLLELQDD